MWRESARLWEASLGIVGMLGLLIGFGIAASFALNNAKRKQDGESARLAPKPSLAEEVVDPITQLAMSLQWEELYTDEYKRRVLTEAIAAALVKRRAGK